MKTILTGYATILLSAICVTGYGQDMTIFNSNLRNKSASQFYQEEFKQVGAYKVKGNSNYLSGNNVSDVYSTLGVGFNFPIVFDTYTQDLSVLLEDRKKQIKLNLDEVDSFIVKSDLDLNNKAPLFFINASHIGSSDKNYLQRLYNGSRYKLYRSFYSELRPAASNVAQTNLREFEIMNEYYYMDMKDPDKQLIKIKPNNRVLKDAFKDAKDALTLLEKGGNKNRDLKLVAFFESINDSN